MSHDLVRAAMTAGDALDDITRARIWNAVEDRIALPIGRRERRRLERLAPRSRWAVIAELLGLSARRPRRAVVLGLACAAAIAGVAMVLVRRAPAPTTIAVASDATLSAPIGPYTRAAIVGPAELDIAGTPGEATAVRLRSGTFLAEFAGGAGRSLRIETPHAIIDIVGTVFAVTVGEATCVAVSHGIVRVTTPALAIVPVGGGQSYCTDTGAQAIPADVEQALQRHERVITAQQPATNPRDPGSSTAAQTLPTTPPADPSAPPATTTRTEPADRPSVQSTPARTDPARPSSTTQSSVQSTPSTRPASTRTNPTRPSSTSQSNVQPTPAPTPRTGSGSFVQSTPATTRTHPTGSGPQPAPVAPSTPSATTRTGPAPSITPTASVAQPTTQDRPTPPPVAPTTTRTGPSVSGPQPTQAPPVAPTTTRTHPTGSGPQPAPTTQDRPTLTPVAPTTTRTGPSASGPQPTQATPARPEPPGPPAVSTSRPEPAVTSPQTAKQPARLSVDELYRAAEAALTRRDAAAADRAFDRLITEYPASPLVEQALYERARIAHQSRAWGAARRHLDRLLALPNARLAEPARYLVCRIAVEARDAEAASCLVDYRKAYPRSPHDRDVLGFLVQLDHAAGGCAATRARIAELVRLYPRATLATAWRTRCPEEPPR